MKSEQHVAELGERESAFKPCLYALLGEHVAHREVLPRVAQEINQPEIAKPTEVVEQQRAALPREVDEIRELSANRSAIMVKRRPIEKVAFSRSS